MLKKRICLVLCAAFTMMTICGCQSSQAAYEDFLDDIEIGMTVNEVIAILGEPTADIASGTVILMYILSDTHVALVSFLSWDGPNGDLPVDMRCTRTSVITYNQFRESYGCDPRDYIQ